MKTFSVTGVSLAVAMALGAHSALAVPTVGAQAAPAVVSAAPADAAVTFRVFLPLRNQQALESLITELHDAKSSQYQKWLEPDEFMQRFGPTSADLATLKRSLTARGFTIVGEDAHGVRVQGSASAVAKAFAVSVHSRTQNAHTSYMAKGTLQLPSEIAGLNARVVGLESLPEHRMHSRNLGPISETPNNRYDTYGPYWFDDLKQAYDYPAYSKQTDGAGVTAAVLMEDLLYPGDVAAAFHHEKYSVNTGESPPSVTTVKVDGGGAVGGPGTFEASLDVQQILGGAPAAAVTLVSIPDLSDAHILDGYAYIVDKNQYDLVNSSFGGCELEYTAPFNNGTDYTYILKQYHEIFLQGTAQGITFSASSGDEGALLCPGPDYGYPGATNVTFQLGVSTPADDPNVTAVGGGNLATTYKSGSLNSIYVDETAYADPEIPYDPSGVGQNVYGGVWAAGGGISQIYAKPKYQDLTKTGSATQRTLPDVGMQVGGCPQSLAESCGANDSAAVVAYGVNYGGGYYGVIGTSVSSPEFVGALALWEQQFGKKHRQGNVNYFLYLMGAAQTLEGGDNAPAEFHYFHRYIPGFDGYYEGGYPSYNYDYIYGLGSPEVRSLFGLKQFPAAGRPQTPGNP